MPRLFWRAVAAAGAALIAVASAPGPAVALPPPPPTAPTCTAHYTLLAEWPGGFVAEVVVSPIVRSVGAGVLFATWEVVVDFPEGQEISHIWNGQILNRNPANGVPTDGVLVGAMEWNSWSPDGQATFAVMGTSEGANHRPALPWCHAWAQYSDTIPPPP